MAHIISLAVGACVLMLLLSSSPGKPARTDEPAAKEIRLVAVLPFGVTYTGKRIPDNLQDESVKEMAEQDGFRLQKTLYGWFLYDKNRFQINWQDFRTTNKILQDSAVDLKGTSPNDLCNILNVDALIIGSSELSKPLTEGGELTGKFVERTFPLDKTDITLTMYGNQGDTLWRFNRVMRGKPQSSGKYGLPLGNGVGTVNIGSSGRMVYVNKILKQAAKNFQKNWHR